MEENSVLHFFFNAKIFYILQYFCKMYILAEKNQDLYMNKDEFKKKIEKKILFVDLKDCIFYKYICKMYMLQNLRVSKKCDSHTHKHTYIQTYTDKQIHRETPPPKKLLFGYYSLKSYPPSSPLLILFVPRFQPNYTYHLYI